MYPNIQYNDPKHRDWLPHTQLPALRSLAEPNCSRHAGLEAHGGHYLDALDLVDQPSKTTRANRHFNAQNIQAFSRAIALVEPEEKQSASVVERPL